MWGVTFNAWPQDHSRIAEIATTGERVGGVECPRTCFVRNAGRGVRLLATSSAAFDPDSMPALSDDFELVSPVAALLLAVGETARLSVGTDEE